MGANRDAANDVYTPLHYTRLVSTVPESAPSLATDGNSCVGYNILMVSTKLVTATGHSFELYFYDGASWILVESSADLSAAEFDPLADYLQHYNVATVQRFALRLLTSVGGSTRVTTNIGV